MRPIRGQKLKILKKKWSEDHNFKALVSSTTSLCITTIFAFYNGFLGSTLSSIWHGSICLFYLLLIAIRGSILFTEYKIKTKNEEEKRYRRQRTFYVTSALLFLLNISLILPISLMVLFKRPIDMGSIPAISMATYTTYKIIMAIIHMRDHKAHHILIYELRTIDLIDALVSILTLQNTLIMVNAAANERSNMLALCAISSAMIYALIVLLTILPIKRYINVKKPRHIRSLMKDKRSIDLSLHRKIDYKHTS